MEQANHHFGPVTAYVTQAAIRYDIRNLRLVFVAAAPKWDVSLYSQQRKAEWRSTFENFRQKGFGSILLARGIKTFNNTLPKRSLSEFGVACESIRYQISDNKGVLPSFYGVFYGKSEKPAGKEYFEMHFLAEKFPPQVNTCLCELADIPGAGVPLTAYYDNGTGNFRYELKTKSVAKAALDKSLFAYPKDYAQTQTSSLLTTLDSPTDVNEAFGEFFDNKKEQKESKGDKPQK